MKPILKWVGGKTQILDKVMENFPAEINNYYEIFLGGGSVLLEFLTRVNNGQIKLHGQVYASDINRQLINCYLNIRDNPESLINELEHIVRVFNSCPAENLKNTRPSNESEALKSKDSYYYWLRIKYNELMPVSYETVQCSALFIFLNKTCFRGLYRIGPNGFNVPYGNYKKPKIFDAEHIRQVSRLIKDINFEISDYNSVLERASGLLDLAPINESQNHSNIRDFIYLDPPYIPLEPKSFVAYNSGGFDLATHTLLLCWLQHSVKDNYKWNFLLSNADVPLIREYFDSNDPRIDIITLVARRAINSAKPDSTAKEILIRNVK